MNVRIRIPSLKKTSVYLMPLTVYVKYIDLCNDEKVVLPRAYELVYVPSIQHISTLLALCSIHYLYGHV